VIGSAAAVLARQRDWPYLNTTGWERRQCPQVIGRSDGRMVQPISTQQEMPARKVAPAIMVAAAGLGAALLSGALVLWFHYGTAVFFEMIASGISACF
jgi:hypothetical protein